MTTPEAVVKNQIRAFLSKLPKCWHMVKDQGSFSVRGLPDIVVCLDGEFLALEVKRPGAKARKLQQFHGAAISKAGGAWACVESVDDVRFAIDMMGKSHILPVSRVSTGGRS